MCLLSLVCLVTEEKGSILVDWEIREDTGYTWKVNFYDHEEGVSRNLSGDRNKGFVVCGRAYGMSMASISDWYFKGLVESCEPLEVKTGRRFRQLHYSQTQL